MREHGYIYMPGEFVHEASSPAGAKAIIILEAGWRVNWLDRGPSIKDLGVESPALSPGS